VSDLKDFEYWMGDYFENPVASEDEKWRLFSEMLEAGNPHAIEHFRVLMHEWRREAIKSGEMREDDQPINTIGSFDVKEVELERDCEEAEELAPVALCALLISTLELQSYPSSSY